jgi:LysM domain
MSGGAHAGMNAGTFPTGSGGFGAIGWFARHVSDDVWSRPEAGVSVDASVYGRSAKAYTVRKGDTLAKIAARYFPEGKAYGHLNWQHLFAYNPQLVSANALKAGEIIILPDVNLFRASLARVAQGSSHQSAIPADLAPLSPTQLDSLATLPRLPSGQDASSTDFGAKRAETASAMQAAQGAAQGFATFQRGETLRAFAERQISDGKLDATPQDYAQRLQTLNATSRSLAHLTIDETAPRDIIVQLPVFAVQKKEVVTTPEVAYSIPVFQPPAGMSAIKISNESARILRGQTADLIFGDSKQQAPANHGLFDYFKTNASKFIMAGLGVVALRRYGRPLALLIKAYHRYGPRSAYLARTRTNLVENIKHTPQWLAAPFVNFGKGLRDLSTGSVRSGFRHFKNAIFGEKGRSALAQGSREIIFWGKTTALFFLAPAVLFAVTKFGSYFISREKRAVDTPLDLQMELALLQQNPDGYMEAYWKTSYAGLWEKNGAPHANGVLLQLDRPLSPSTPYVRRVPLGLLEAMEASGQFKDDTHGHLLVRERMRAEDGTLFYVDVAYIPPYRHNMSDEHVNSLKRAEGTKSFVRGSYRYEFRFGPRDDAAISLNAEMTTNYAYGAPVQTIAQFAGATVTQTPGFDVRLQQTNLTHKYSLGFMLYDNDRSGIINVQNPNDERYGTAFSMGGNTLYLMAGTRQRIQIGGGLAGSKEAPKSVAGLFSGPPNLAELRARFTPLVELGYGGVLAKHVDRSGAAWYADFYAEAQNYSYDQRAFYKRGQGMVPHVSANKLAWSPIGFDYAWRVVTTAYQPDWMKLISAPGWRGEELFVLEDEKSGEPKSKRAPVQIVEATGPNIQSGNLSIN